MKNYKKYIIFTALISALLTAVIISSILKKDVVIYDEIKKNSYTDDKTLMPSQENTISIVLETDEEVNFEPVFYESVITDEIFDIINGNSYDENDEVSRDDLRYLKVTHFGYDDESHYGELIVHKSVSEEVLLIFKDLYENEFPIEKIKLVDFYESNDILSMEDNNTSAFNFRKISGTTIISNHGYGLAIDINPVQNPYKRGSVILPKNGEDNIIRSELSKGMIVKNDPCYNAFVTRGWSWGGSWNSVKDYQHFEKIIPDINN